MSARKLNPLWWQQALEVLSEEFLEIVSGDDLVHELRRRRVLDLNFGREKITARVQEEAGKSFRVEFFLPPYGEEVWNAVLERYGADSIVFACLLAGNLPPECEEAFEAGGVTLIPRHATEIPHKCECGANRAFCPHRYFVWTKIVEKITEDPFTILSVRGKSREEILAHLRRRREGDRQRALAQLREEVVPENEIPAAPVTNEEFYSHRAELDDISYDIRADELPAAILKWVEPLPLGELAHELEAPLEEAYARVARRAQTYGLGLRR